MSNASYNRNPLRKHCLEVSLAPGAVRVTLDALGSQGRKIADVEVPVTSPRMPEDIARAIIRDWRPDFHGIAGDAARLRHLETLCRFHARASVPGWEFPNR